MDEYMAYIWIGVAVVMTIAEIGTAQLVSVWFVIGALCAAVTCLFTGNWQIQLIVFVSVSLLTLLVTRPLVKKFKKKVVKVNTNADRMIGEIGVMQNGISEIHCVFQRISVRSQERSEFDLILSDIKSEVLIYTEGQP